MRTLPVPTQMALSSTLAAILNTAKVGEEFKAFLVASGLTDVDQVALMAANESKLEDSTFPLLQAAGIPTESLAQIISLKKAWRLCRTAMGRDEITTTGRFSTPSTAVMPAPDINSLTTTWKKKRDYRFLGTGFLQSN